ncbi:MAG: YerC/YecD family TrpR-related protein [Pseudomonadota bacterium]
MRGPGKATDPERAEDDLRTLFEAFGALRSGAEAARFLRDLATPAELGAFAERWRIARLLDEGAHSYRAISEETGASTATIARVARFLRNEDHQGYRLVLDRL